MEIFTGNALFDMHLLDGQSFTELIYSWLSVISTNVEEGKRRKVEMIFG
jgi:hypothetical protein